MKKKLLVVLLAMAMVLCFAATALAADPTVKLEAEDTDFLLGAENQEVTLEATVEGEELDTTPIYYDKDGDKVSNIESLKDSDYPVTKVTPKEYVVSLLKGNTAITDQDYKSLSNGSYSADVDVDTSKAGSITSRANRYIKYEQATIATKGDSPSTPEITYNEVPEGSPDILDDARATIKITPGLTSAVVSTRSNSTSSSYTEELNTDVLESTATFENNNSDTLYLHLDYDNAFEIDSVKIGSSKLEEVRTDVFEIDMSKTTTRTIEVVVKEKASVNNTITYEFTVKQVITPYLDDLFVSSSSRTSNSYKYPMYPSFDKEEDEYTVFIPYERNGRTVYVHADPDKNSEAYLGRTGNTEIDGSETVTIDDSDPIYVRAVAGDAKTEYKINVYYAGSGADDDADLDGLDVETSTRSGSGYKDATVSKTGNTYNVYVSKDQEYARITLDKSDRNAYIIYNDEVYSSQEAFSGLALKDGKNTFTFVVMAEDCETTETYTVNIYLGVSSVLADLTATGFVHEMTPDFDADQNVYIGYVANKTSSTTITAEAADEDAKIYIYSETDGDSKTGTGKAYDTFKLKEGLNNFRITVATSSSSKDYTYYYLSIYRQPAKTTARVSNQTVTVNGRDKDLYCYNINGNNFIQLRDFAYIMKGQDKQFNVEYTSNTYTANLTSGEAYTGERTKSLSSNITIKATTQNLKLDGESIYPMAYNINGNNYIMLRDLCALLDIGCTYSSTSNSISLNGNSSATYTPQN